MLKLNRNQELQLIDLGLETLLNRMTPKVKKVVKKMLKPEKKEYKMSAKARKAVSERMKNYWEKRRTNHK